MIDYLFYLAWAALWLSGLITVGFLVLEFLEGFHDPE